MILIGIDTGVKTGFAHSIDGVLQDVSTQTILSAQDRVLEIRDEAAQSDVKLVVCIEDVRKRTWVDPSIGKERLKGVGSVTRDCSIWQEFCERNGLRHILVPPSNIDTKRSAEDFEMITGWTARTSGHARDAGMMIYKYHRLIDKGVVDVPAPKPIKKKGGK
ncbi:MAG: hypothetical protein BAX61_03070 [Psychrobacter sp. B29-1]|uniref:hypothetical protein n=1 Tax=Psychrobacter sp. B29-1 TaxID=1867800 RepID=UPI00086D1600|nr:hypothetical protein [Psychrobacter sp. B29-1]OEH69182.1 MAG: hypothetical protein BAX61_03070 [Psychrobacter sp. B29-1]